MNLQMSDLIVPCDKCKGSGRILPPTDPRPAMGMGATIWHGDCEACNGLGGKLTANGKVVRDFLLRLKRANQLT